MDDDDTCTVEDCDHAGFVQVGMPPRLVCHCHFEEYLANAANLVRRIASAIADRHDVVVVHSNGHRER